MASPTVSVADVFKGNAKFQEANHDGHSQKARYFVKLIQEIATDVKTGYGKEVGTKDEPNIDKVKQIETELKEDFEAVVYGRVAYEVSVNVKDGRSEEDQKEPTYTKKKSKVGEFCSSGDVESNILLNNSRATSNEDVTGTSSQKAKFEINVLHAAILAQEIGIVRIILSIASDCIDNNKTEDTTNGNSLKLPKADILMKLLNGLTSLRNLGEETAKNLIQKDKNLDGLNMCSQILKRHAILKPT